MKKVKCICEPRGDHGLEGYSLGDEYGFKREGGFVHLYSVGPVAPPLDGFLSMPYPRMNTTTERKFGKYFKVVGQ